MLSIERTLLRLVMAALLIGAVSVSGTVYFATLEEFNEALDAELKHVATSLARYRDLSDASSAQRPAGTGRVAEPELEDSEIETFTRDAAGKLLYASDEKVRMPFIDSEGLTRVSVGGESWIVYTARHRVGYAQAAQRVDSRRAIARESATRILPPMLLLAMGIGGLLIYGLRLGLRPLDAAARDVAGRSARSLAPIDCTRLPAEITPMVQAINGLMARLDDSMTAQRRFLADAAHELRSPITALRLQLQLLDRSSDGAANAAARADLQQGVDRAQRLVEQLLQVARTEPEAQIAPMLPLDLGSIVREVVEAASAKAEAWQLDLGATLAEEVPVLGDRSQLLILLNNLVENALRHTPSGGVIDVGAEMRDGRPVLFVLDTGPGIPKAERERVFDRFYRGGQPARSGRAALGSGLGLAIVKAIAGQHGAVVELLDRVGEPGLEVRVSFPRR
ncbi:ATP-binding protein [Roseateles saccharophilus]|uniref:histidine kinase n=2 Tax=Roseateles saccharophilus TaxID=304 RepID=A0A4R3UQL5_ROSSA|nr:two-component system OmpR family sensor kinase/two-component system sensor histidine kinase QseC [Roseateles saccharophilus]